MIKRFVALSLIISVVLVPCFAYADTASTISLYDHLALMADGGIDRIEVAAAEAAALGDGTKATGDTSVFLNGFSQGSSVYYLYYPRNGLMQNESYPSGYTYLPGLFSGLSYSIAHNTQVLISSIPSYTTYIDGIEGMIDGLESSVSTISTNSSTTNTRLNTINTSIGSSNTKLDNIYNAILNQSLSIPQILIDNVQTLTDNQVPKSQFTWPSGFNQNFTINRYRQVADGGLSSDLTINPTQGTILSRIWYWFANYSNSAIFAFRDLTSGVSPNTTKTYLNSSLSSVQLGRSSLWVDIRTLGVNINDAVMRLAYVLANDEEIAARQAASSNTAAAVSSVISSSGSGSASVSDITGFANLKTGVTSSLSSGASASTVFTELGSDGDAWGWFSQACQDELSAPSRRSNVRSDSKSSVSDTPMLDAYYHDLEEALGFKLW